MVSNRKFSLLLLSLLPLLLGGCHVTRYFWWNYADIRDNMKFSGVPVMRSGAAWMFHPGTLSRPLHLPAAYGPATEPLDRFLNEHGTVSFLVIRNDTILHEAYFGGYSQNEPIPAFSVAKSFVSALTGIALEEGSVRSLNQPVTDYLHFLKDTGFKHITLKNLLEMRSGLRFSETYGSPFGLMPKFYYGRNLKKYAAKLKVGESPDLQYNYQSANTLLLSLVLEEATGMPLNLYLQEKLWKPMEMESDASWSTDSRKHRTVKAFCCLNAVTRDYARFGRLYLNKGNWNGKQLVPEHWIEETLKVTNDSRDSGGHPYTYYWRVMPGGAIFAKGVLGQYIYVDYGKKLVMVRMGKKNGGTDWPAFFSTLASQL